MLPYGEGYSLVEVQAPYGYVIDRTPVYFDVAQDNSTEESGVTVIKVNKENMAQKGVIIVEKTGEVFWGVNVSGDEDSETLYQPVYQVSGLAGAVLKSVQFPMLSRPTERSVMLPENWSIPLRPARTVLQRAVNSISANTALSRFRLLTVCFSIPRPTKLS